MCYVFVVFSEDEMKTKEIDEMITNYLMDKNKVKEKVEFKYRRFMSRRLKVNFFSYGIITMGFILFPEIFKSSIHDILMSILIVLIAGGIYQGVRFFLMNKELNALRGKLINIYLSFFWLVFAIGYAALSILLACIAPDSEFLAMIRVSYFFILFIFSAHFCLFLWWYVHPVFEILYNFHNSKNDDYFDRNAQ